LGVILGGGLVFLLSALEGRYYTKEEIQAALRQQSAPMLELLPLFLPPRGLEGSEEFVPLMTDNLSPYLNSYERLRGTIQRTGTKGTKVVLVSSAMAGEGKTHCAYNLAIASAFAGKRTLLIEADLRKPTLIRALGVAPDLGSTVEPLQYYGNTSDCIRLVPSLENLFIVPSTGPQRQPSAILESSEMRRLLEDARGRFDFVVIDSPSLLRYNDAMLLDPFVDGLVLVTRPGITQASMFVEAIEVISDNQLPFFGVVINGTDISVDDEVSVDDDDDIPRAYSQATGIYAPYGEVQTPHETLI
jgi:capsular exopolysaccharide synthesis family protein